MGYARRGPEENGCVKFFADLKGPFDEFFCFLGIGRLQHGNFSEFGIIPVILLVL